MSLSSLVWKVFRRQLSSRSSSPVVRKLLSEIPNTEAGTKPVPVSVSGWIRSIREQKHITFLHLDDGSSVNALQVTIVDTALRGLPLSYGAAVTIRGNLVPSAGSRQAVELLAQEIVIVRSNNAAEYPFKARTRHEADHYRQFLHLRPRAEQFASLLRVRSAATLAVHEFFQENEFVLVHTPIFTSNDCEGGGETFVVMGDEDLKRNIQFFGTHVALTVSGQLHLEAAVCGLSRVYNFNPAFRAERQQSRRHLSEFWMIEAEIAFLDNLDVLLNWIEHMLKSVTQKVLDRAAADISYHLKNVAEKNHQEKLDKLLNKPFVRVPYTEALEILFEKGENFRTPPRDGENLTREHELFLVKHLGDVPVFVTHFPSRVKPFYARHAEENHTYALAADLIVPDVGELYGGSLREHRYDVLLDRCTAAGQLEKLNWYLELRKFGGPPTGGFGMGFERYLQYLLGIVSIKDVIPFPRWINHCDM